MKVTDWARLAVAWGTVAVFIVAGPAWVSGAGSPYVPALLFFWLLGVIVWSAFGGVHAAEDLAEVLGDPLGTLVLTLSIVVIEVALVCAVMLGAKAAPTLGRDTMFAVLMIVLNGVVGLGLLLGGLRHHQQSFNLQGASAYLAVIIPLAMIALVLPNFTTSTEAGTLSNLQAVFFSIFTLLLYGVFLVLQTGRHKDFFVEPGGGAPAGHGTGGGVSSNAVTRGVALLLVSILPIVVLSKSLAAILDYEITAIGAPPALGGVLIAIVVFLPEGISALRAVSANALQRGVNLCLGAVASTLGLTVPAVLIIAVLTGQTVTLGLAPNNMVLLATTLILSTLTFSGSRTTTLEGAVHLVMFFVFVVLIFSP